MSDTETETSTDKGDRNEREAVNIIGRVRGSGNVEKVDARANTDPFTFADIIAIGNDKKILFVQVKTNRFSADDRRRYKRQMRRLNFKHAIFEVWVRVDYEGWRMYRYSTVHNNFQQYIKMNTCDHEKTVEKYREYVGYYKEDTK